jgi:hypothetical protein
MSRGIDGPEIDDFHRSQRDVNRSPESNRRAGWDTVRRLERIRGEEERADQRDQEARGAAALVKLNRQANEMAPAAADVLMAAPMCTVTVQ